MSADARSPLEVVLRLVAAAAPQSYYPRLHAEKAGVPLDHLLYILEHLWLDGLLQKGSTSEAGGGVQLSPFGEEVLRDPEALRRLADGEAVKPGDRGGIVRAVFRKPQQSRLTRWLLWVNILWFGMSLYVAQSRHKAGKELLTTFGNVNDGVIKALHESGSVSPDDLIHGEWWRLMSCCFVHIGLLHLAFNMYGVYAIGRGAEQLWGLWRYLAIYLLSGFSGSCVALAYRPTILAGASGALCGILGAEFVWLFLNGRFLPRRIVRRWWWGMAINLLLLGGLSAMANVSALGHFGGMGVGAAAALLFNVQRFGQASWRWLALVPLAAVPWLGIELIQRQRAVNELWAEAEDRTYTRDYSRRVLQALFAGSNVTRRANNESTEKRLEATLQARTQLATLDAELSRPGQFRSKKVKERCSRENENIEVMLKEVNKKIDELSPLVEKEVKDKEEEEKARAKRKVEDDKEEAAFTKEFWKGIKNATTEAMTILREQAQPLFKLAPEKRAAAEVEATRMALGKKRTALQKMARDLKNVGEYRSENAEKARRVGKDYVIDLDRLLALAEKRLLGGAAWTGEQEWKERSDIVDLRRREWDNLWEDNPANKP